MSKLHQLIACLLCVSAFTAHGLIYATTPCETTVDFTIKQKEGGGIGHEKGYFSAELLSAFLLDTDSALFFDLRGHHLYHKNKLATNIGLGYRQKAVNPDLIFGVNAYYDRRDMHNNWFQQIGLGIDIFSDCVDFRCNGYFPVGKKRDKTCCSWGEFHEHTGIAKRHFYQPLRGIDVEAGRSLFCWNIFKLYGAVGSYYFSRNNSSTKAGLKARLQGDISQYLTVEISNSYDQLFHNNFQGYLAINIPFYSNKEAPSCCTSNPCELTLAYLAQKPVRQEIIPVDHTHKKKTLKDVYFIHVNNTSTNGDGTFEHPYSTSESAQNNSKKGDIIYFQRGDGSSYGHIVLQDNQQLFGAGTNQTIYTHQCGRITIPALTPCQSPVLESTTNNVVTLANNNQISGLRILSDDSKNGIYGNEINSAALSHNDISNCDNGIELNNIEEGTYWIINNNLHDNNDYGLSISAEGGSPSFYIIHNNSQNNNRGANIDTRNDCKATYVIQHNNLSNNNIGIKIENHDNCSVTGIISHNVASNSGSSGSGIILDWQDESEVNFIVACNEACNNGEHGIQLDGRNYSLGHIYISDNNLCNNGDRGLNADNENNAETHYTVVNNRFSGSGDSQDLKFENKDSAILFLEAVGNYSEKDMEMENDGSTFRVKAENLADFEAKNSFDNVVIDGTIDYSLD